MCARYISEDIMEIKARKKAMESMPKLPVDRRLYISLPKALRQLSKETYNLSDSSVCAENLKSLISPLLLNYNTETYVVKDDFEREKIKEALLFFDKNKVHKMLEEYHKAVSEILKMNIFWVRDISTWDWKSRNSYKQLKSLIEHLFCEYKVPEFMFQAWTDKVHDNTHIEWFLHLASGKTAKKLYKFPISPTSKMVHEFINTPFPGYSISDAIRRSQVMGMGGSDRLADAILMSRLRHNFTNDNFWTSVIQFFINTPMLNFDEVGTVIDYINEKKFVSKHVMRDGKRYFEPEMPNFNIKGRNIQTLIRDTHLWHSELRKYGRADMSSKWLGTGLETFVQEEGMRDRKNYKIYEIVEITNAKELHREGSSMHHCVFSYLSSCVKGTCFIFSLRLFGTSLVTIEVRDNRAVQIRGPYNRKPDQKEINVIQNWAKKENIEITNYAIGGR